MQTTLLKSFILVFLFWWMAFTVGFGLADPATNLEVLARLAETLPSLGLEVPASINIMEALSVQWTILTKWTPLAFSLSVIATLLGVGAAWGYAYLQKKARIERELGRGVYRGIQVTMGEIPVPITPPVTAVEMVFAKELEGQLASLPDQYRDLLNEIFGLLAGNPDAYVGDGHGVSLVAHSLNVLIEAVESGVTNPLSLIAAAAHDIGKITAWDKDKRGQWRRLKMHDKESARLLALMPSFGTLPIIEQYALTLAVGYEHSGYEMPQLGGQEAKEKALQILADLRKADQAATKQEKLKVLEKLPLPEMIFKAFVDSLPSMTFQSPGLGKKVDAVGWRKGTRLYLLEIQIREQSMRQMDPEVTAALGGSRRDSMKLAAFTVELLKALESKGWLVREVGKAKVGVEEALWNVLAGTKEFKGVIIVDVPDTVTAVLPPDSAYSVSVTGPHFTVPGAVAMQDGDLDGVLVAPGSRKRKPKPAPAPDAASEVVADQSKPDAVSVATPAPGEPLTPVSAPAARPDPVTELGPIQSAPEQATASPVTSEKMEEAAKPAPVASAPAHPQKAAPAKPNQPAAPKDGGPKPAQAKPTTPASIPAKEGKASPPKVPSATEQAKPMAGRKVHKYGPKQSVPPISSSDDIFFKAPKK